MDCEFPADIDQRLTVPVGLGTYQSEQEGLPNHKSFHASFVVLLSLVLNPCAFADDPITYDRHIRPILADRCFNCHGRDEGNRQAELRLDVRDDAVQAAIVPGDSNASELIARIASADPDQRMPPADSHKKPLDRKQIELIRRWIDQGAEYASHWAFIPPKRPLLPNVSDRSWVGNSIDAFVLSRLEQEGLKPSDEANRSTLIRRVTLDLTGVPPSALDVERFVNDQSANAYEKVVDRLLKSQRYGEHLARYWLDAARYADTNGYQYDLEREQWVWRDWVIHALNTNMPFDQFTVEQLAGDLLPGAADQQRLATAFNRNHPITIEGGVIDEEYRTEYVVDRVVTTSTVWLGLTMLCGRCHDHKYDPISQKEFYQFFAFFNQVPERGKSGFDPKIIVTSPLQAETFAALDEQISVASPRFQEFAIENRQLVTDWEKQLHEQVKDQWRVNVPIKMRSDGGTEFSVQEDQSLLAGGKKPAQETYEFILRADTEQIRAIRLEALSHSSFVNKSTGRGSSGNFVLGEFEIAAARLDSPGEFMPVKIAWAEADYSQHGFNVTLAIDGKVDSTGWAVDGDTKHENRQAVFTFAEPVGFDGGTLLRVRLIHNYGANGHVGRVRLALPRGTAEPVPLPITAIVAVAAEKRSAQQQQQLDEYLIGRFGAPTLRTAGQKLTTLRRRRLELVGNTPETMVMDEMAEPRATHVLYRGEYDKPRAQVQAGTPAVFPPMPPDAPRNRLGFAKWLVMPNHPLTARVTVNRFWQRLFGKGIVSTTEDFGTQGKWPSHPELLDWLAVEFVESGWNVKALQKLMVMSATYRQLSRVTSERLDHDPENRLLARGPRVRLDAEVIRDSALLVSGLLVEKAGGPSVFPYQPKGLWQEINNRPGYSRVYKQDRGDNLYRRSLYTFWKRTVPPPTMAMFDAPGREYCVVSRSRTNTPLQAFVLLHDPQFVEAARHLAERMMVKGGDTVSERLSYGFLLCTSREPSRRELDILGRTFETRLKQYREDRAAVDRLLSVGQHPRDDTFDLAEHATYTTVARLLLNLSEFVTKG